CVWPPHAEADERGYLEPKLLGIWDPDCAVGKVMVFPLPSTRTGDAIWLFRDVVVPSAADGLRSIH
ncbi:MAG: hypothetical protein WBA31_01745, partial [Candidatus Dormiibacterota bacterium]